MKIEEEAAARKRAEFEARKKAEDEKKSGTETPKDTEMKDADAVKPDDVEEPK